MKGGREGEAGEGGAHNIQEIDIRCNLALSGKIIYFEYIFFKLSEILIILIFFHIAEAHARMQNACIHTNMHIFQILNRCARICAITCIMNPWVIEF